MNDLCALSATALLACIYAKEVSAREVMAAHVARIERANPRLNAIVTLDAESALAAAARADEAYARGETVGPLHGLPVAHKDSFLTRGMRTTFGSPIFAQFIPAHDSIIVERQRRAGAISVGKTNMPEFAAGSHTFNPVFGVTRNPYDPSKSCGGSSGGAAVALATGMVALADGSDLGGSLRNPASFCNVVGLRPSIGRVPQWPSQDAWGTLAVAGPMARTVEDVALFLRVLAGSDARDPIALDDDGARLHGSLHRDFAGTRVAWSADLGGLPIEPAVRAVLTPQHAIFTELGCEVAEASPDLGGADEVFATLRGVGFVNAFDALERAQPASLKETIRWNLEVGRALTGVQVGAATLQRSQIFARMHDFMQTYEFLIAPVSQVSPFPIEHEYPTQIDGVPMHDYLEWMRSCSRITVTGHPAISVPCGFTAAGLPVGIQIVGRYRDDLGVLQLAYAFQERTRATISRSH